MAKELLATVDRLYPDPSREDPRETEPAPGTEELVAKLRFGGVPVAALRTGYVQAVRHGPLLEVARTHEVIVGLHTRTGDHTIDDTVLALVWPPARASDELHAGILEAIEIGHSRTPHDDVSFSALLLEEMAVRALSPSTNDPYTRSTPSTISQPVSSSSPAAASRLRITTTTRDSCGSWHHRSP